jgi:ketosteroid isomerase-like protein
MRIRSIVALLVVAAACRQAETLDQRAARMAGESAAARQAIDAINANWARFSTAGHADSIAEFYHVNAMILPPNMPPVRGRDSIRAFMAVINTMSSPPPVLSVWSDSVWASGPLAVDVGRWTFVWPAGAKRPPGSPAADSGKYMARWVNENGRWLMMEDIWNSDVAPPQAGGSQ